MRAQFILPALIVAGDDGKLPTGRQGREGRDFLSPIRQPNGRNNHIHERRPRTYACEGKNNADIVSRPSRPARPPATIAGPHSAHFGGSDTHLPRCHRPAVVVHRILLAAEIAKGAS
jgi:hypothetical protein